VGRTTDEFRTRASPRLRTRQQEVGALHVADEGFGLLMAALDAPHAGDEPLQGVIAVGSLAGVRVAGLALAWLGLGNVHVVSRRELQRVLAV
jgi:hypothetical protein